MTAQYSGSFDLNDQRHAANFDERRVSRVHKRSAYFPSDDELLPPVLEEYIAAFGREPDDRPHPVLIVQPFAGYADRIKGIVTIFAVAVICKRRFAIRWIPDAGIETVFTANRFDWTRLPATPPEMKALWTFKASREIAAFMRQGQFDTWMERNLLSGDGIVNIACNQNLLADLLADESVARAFGSTDAAAVFKMLFRVLFKLNPEAPLTQPIEHLMGRIESRPSIGVHIRVGGNGRWGDPQFEDAESVYRFEQKVSSIVEEYNLDNPVIYLASDSIEIKAAAKTGDFLKGFDVIQQDIQPYHIDYVGEKLQAQKVLSETVIDHIVLSLCDHVVHGNGGFAVTASQLGGNCLHGASLPESQDIIHESNARQLRYVISVCLKRDSHVWQFASRAILDRISSDNYILIVPDSDVEFFKQITPSLYQVFGEQALFPFLKLDEIKQRMPPHRQARAGWYYQQLLKIAALIHFPCDDEALLALWDADTVPLREVDFLDADGRVSYFTGTEHHKPYFGTVERLLGLTKRVDYSFIAQCFPVRKKWIIEFIKEISLRSEKLWFEAILESADFNNNSGFSEYETIGTFLTHRHSSDISICSSPWERNGAKKYRVEDVIESEIARERFAFIAFEHPNTQQDHDDLAKENRNRNPLIAQAYKLITERFRAEKSPQYFRTNLTAHEQTFERGKPRPYIDVACRLLELMAAKNIVEIGSMRHPIRHSPDDFDPTCCNDGHSTIYWARTGRKVYSVDINSRVSAVTSEACKNYPNVSVHNEDGIAFLRSFSDTIDFLYLDAWDVIAGTPYAERHLEAFHAAQDKLAAQSLILIDDTDILFGGTGRLAVPAIIRDGFIPLISGRQTMLLRTT
jgi:hypothetical protein